MLDQSAIEGWTLLVAWGWAAETTSTGGDVVGGFWGGGVGEQSVLVKVLAGGWVGRWVRFASRERVCVCVDDSE